MNSVYEWFVVLGASVCIWDGNASIFTVSTAAFVHIAQGLLQTAVVFVK